MVKLDIGVQSISCLKNTTPGDHDKLQKRKDENNEQRQNKFGGSGNANEKKKLALADSLKAALLARRETTGAKIDAMLSSDVTKESDFPESRDVKT